MTSEIVWKFTCRSVNEKKQQKEEVSSQWNEKEVFLEFHNILIRFVLFSSKAIYSLDWFQYFLCNLISHLAALISSFLQSLTTSANFLCFNFFPFLVHYPCYHLFGCFSHLFLQLFFQPEWLRRIRNSW